MVRKFIPPNEYRIILENVPLVCVNVIIPKDNAVLVVYRLEESAKGEWWIPGGRVYKNEKLGDTAVRIARQEVGLDVTVKKLVGIYDEMFDKGALPDLKNGVHYASVIFLCEALDDDQEIKLDETSSDYRWIDKIEEGLHPYLKRLLKESKVFL